MKNYDDDNDGDATVSNTTSSCNIPQPTPRMMLKLNICDTNVAFLYEPESQVTIITL